MDFVHEKLNRIRSKLDRYPQIDDVLQQVEVRSSLEERGRNYSGQRFADQMLLWGIGIFSRLASELDPGLFLFCRASCPSPHPSFRFREQQYKTHVRKEYFVCGFLVLMAATVLYGLGIASLCQLVGFAYPAFKSFQAIETKARGDDTQWLVYWVIFAFFQIIEVFIDLLIYWIPFYYAFKLAFLLWLMLPQTKGATFMYDAFLKDFLKKNESRIDAAMNDAKRQAAVIADEFSSAGAGGGEETKKDT